MAWLVTGGAGYIGAHVVRALGDQGLASVGVDDLSSGHRDFVDGALRFYEGNVNDTQLLR